MMENTTEFNEIKLGKLFGVTPNTVLYFHKDFVGKKVRSINRRY